MKRLILVGGVTALMLAFACQTQHQYVVERVKDVGGNDAFLRIDLTVGDECTNGHGFGVVRLKPGRSPEDGYLVPFCDGVGKPIPHTDAAKP